MWDKISCENCDRIDFKSYDAYLIHTKACGKVLICKKCGKKKNFRSYNGFKLHEDHCGETFQCTHCKKIINNEFYTHQRFCKTSPSKKLIDFV